MEGRNRQEQKLLTTVLERITQNNNDSPSENFNLTVESVDDPSLTADILIDYLYNHILMLRTKVIDKESNILSRLLSIDEDTIVWARTVKMNNDKEEHSEPQNELSAFQQQLVIHYRENILSGKCVAPTQLRSILPICKNAYKQTIFIQSEYNQFEEINSYYHSGTAAYLSNKNRAIAIAITKQNLEQQKICQQNSRVHHDLFK